MTDPPPFEGLVCPAPVARRDRVVLGHGSGGRLMHDLVARVFVPAFDNPALRAGDDAAVVRAGGRTRWAISTDCHVVSPLFFRGGDIGRLAVCGTVNDVAMLGATPRFLTAGFVMEEGLELATLERVVESVRVAAEEAGVAIVAGDTKVVQRGKADGLYITTAGFGTVRPGVSVGGSRARPGDAVVLSGPVGDHGIAVLAARGELGFEAEVASDVAPLAALVAALLDATPPGALHALRDPTRGGLATTLAEIARQSRATIVVEESRIPVRPPVRAACELLGLDPLYVANEGKLVAFVAAGAAEAALAAMRAARHGGEAVAIGEVRAVDRDAPPRVLLRTPLGTHRLLDLPSGELLPRIC